MTTALLALALLAAACAALTAAAGITRLDRRRAMAAALVVLAAYAILLAVRPSPLWVSGAAVVLAGAGAGHLLGLALGSTGAVIAFLTAAAVVDLLSFSDGLTHRILEAYRSGGSTLLRYLAVFVHLDGREYAVVGIGDLLILTAAWSGLSRATRSAVAPAVWLLAGLLAAFVVGITLGGAPGLPFLAGAGIGFALVHGRHRTLEP